MGFHSAVPRLKASILRGVPFPLPCSSVDSFSRLPFLQLQPFEETKLWIFIAAISATEASLVLKAQQQPRPLGVTVLGVINSLFLALLTASAQLALQRCWLGFYLTFLEILR